jgi:hypothetical protein
MARRAVKITRSPTAKRAKRKASATLSRVQDALVRAGDTTRAAVGSATAQVKATARKAARTLKRNKQARVATAAVAGLAVATAAGVLARKKMKRR